MDHLDKGYFETTFNISQKASLSSLMHSKAYELMAEEATIYEICFHSLQAVASQDEAVIKEADKRIQELLQHHRDDIIELHRYGAAVKQVAKFQREYFWELGGQTGRNRFSKWRLLPANTTLDLRHLDKSSKLSEVVSTTWRTSSVLLPGSVRHFVKQARQRYSFEWRSLLVKSVRHLEKKQIAKVCVRVSLIA